MADEIVFTKEEYRTVLQTAADVADIKKDLATFITEQKTVCGRLDTIEKQHEKEAAVGGFVSLITSRTSAALLFLCAVGTFALDLWVRIWGGN